MRRLRSEDAELWRRVARNVAPLARRFPNNPPPLPAEPSPASGGGQGGGLSPSGGRVGANTGSATAAPARPQQPPAPPLDRFAGVDRATAERFRRGRRPIEARLDLHGMTQMRAHRALTGFLHRAHHDGLTFVLVITGKGRSGGESGVLRRQVPEWLSLPEFRAFVVGFEEAHIGHGGEGALYVRIRRARY